MQEVRRDDRDIVQIELAGLPIGDHGFVIGVAFDAPLVGELCAERGVLMKRARDDFARGVQRDRALVDFTEETAAAADHAYF